LGAPGGNLLIDCSPDFRTQMLRERLGIVHAALFTHSHADHLHGLDDLRLFPHYTGEPVPLYCEEPVENRIRAAFDYAFRPPVSSEASLPQLTFRRLTLKPFEALGLQVQPIRLKHGAMDVLGFRFGNLAYCTDVNHIPEESLSLLQDLDVLILDCLRPKPHPSHFHVDAAVEMATRLNAKRTIFTHISCKLDHDLVNGQLPDRMELGHDGLRVSLKPELHYRQDA
ncbi:MAG: MBL fold metallo-hydrolase, partial [Planctomycetales bacterium]